MSNQLDEKWEAEAAELRRQIGKLCAVPAPGSLVVRQRLAALETRCLKHAAEYRAAHPGWTEFSDEPGGMPEERGDMLLQVRWRRDAGVTCGAPQTRYFRFVDGEWWSEKCNGCNSAHLGLVCRGEEWLFVPLPGGGS